MLPLLDKSLILSQKYLKKTHPLSDSLLIKPNAHVRIHRNMNCAEFDREMVPRSADVGKLVVFRGKVVRTGMVKMLETLKSFECIKCGQSFAMKFDREQYNLIPKPHVCATQGCIGTKFKEVVLEAGQLPNSCKDYQEIKVQEDVAKLSMGTIPKSITVILEDDLADECKAGDDVSVTGLVSRRWRSFIVNERCDVEIFLIANNIHVHGQNVSSVPIELGDEFKEFWDKYKSAPMIGRNIILESFCPRIFGMYLVKLAVLLVLTGGVAKTENRMRIRGDSHLLMVGDPGIGKSQFLRYASRVVPRSVQTTGIGSTTAGLTVAAVKDSGEWQLEAGALVLADRGLCCIDEFGSIRESDKTAIHEAMEQQTISVAKAGLVCKLNTRCSILAATNPKGKYDPNQDIEINIALASPLLSRFDLILILLDSQNPEWDEKVSTFLLDNEVADAQGPIHSSASTREKIWSIDKMTAYLQYIKSHFQPRLSEEANMVLKTYYQAHRTSDIRNAARTTIRLLESLIRLSQAHARLMCQNTVTVRDAIVAVVLIEASMQSCALNTMSSTLHASFPEDPMHDYFTHEDTILGKLSLAHLSTRDHDPPPGDRDQENLDPHEDTLCSWHPTPKAKIFRQDPSMASGHLVSPICLYREDDFFSQVLMADLGFLGNSGYEL